MPLLTVHTDIPHQKYAPWEFLAKFRLLASPIWAYCTVVLHCCIVLYCSVALLSTLLQVRYTGYCTYVHRRKIYTEEKAKVVAAAWGIELLQFPAAPAILSQDKLKDRILFVLG